MSIHRLIREGRARLRLSEEEFGKRVGVSRSAVQQWEKEDGTAPNRSRQQAVAELLGISVAELMGSEPPTEWPFERLQPDHVRMLSAKDRRTVENLAFSLLQEEETPGVSEVSDSNVVASPRKSEEVTWTLPIDIKPGRSSGKRDSDAAPPATRRRGGSL